MPWNRANRKRFIVCEYVKTQRLASVEAVGKQKVSRLRNQNWTG